MEHCCKPYLYGWWKGNGVTLFQRHQGKTCVGRMDELDFPAFFRTGKRRIVR